MVNWRRNLAALWLAEFTAIFGFSFAFPFLSVFLHRDLGIQSDHDLAFWTGIAASASGFSMAVASPIWGILADRYGRRPMLLRAMIGGCLTVGLMGLAQNALQLTGLRFLQGAASGTVAAATALVASETPREQVAWSLGILTSAIALGSAIGPAVGGLSGSAFGLRTVFFGGGALLLLATVPVILVVRESPARLSRPRASAPLQVLRSGPAGTVGALAVLIAGQALMQSSASATQQLMVLRLLKIEPAAVSTLTGIAFGASGLAAALAGISYARAIRITGYRMLVVLAAPTMAVATLAVALVPGVVLAMIAFVVVSFLYGALIPLLTSMIGLETPVAVQATVYGVSASAISIGFGSGPLISGLTAASAGITAGFMVAAGLALLLAILIAVAGREPAR